MKTFNAPTIEIEKLNVTDVIATSGDVCDGYDPCDNFVCPID